MEKTTTPWSIGAVFICSKCGKKMGRPELADQLKDEFKGRMKQIGKGHDVRVMVSGCLDECPDDLQAVVYTPVEGKTETWVFDPDKERAQVLAEIEKKANQG